jgi:thiamine biosynthesis lipoprotein
MVLTAICRRWFSVGLVACWFSPAAWAADDRRLERHAATERHMGTQFHVVLYSDDQVAANRAIGQAFARIAALDRALSNYQPDSELNQLCRHSPQQGAIPVSLDLWHVLRTADALSRRTDGAFDVTIGPLTKLWRRARRRHELPAPERIAEARERVGYRLVRYRQDPPAVLLERPGMQLDLGGIAKGYATDEALRVLREAGITRALVNGGGDLSVGNPPPDAAGWRVDVASFDAGSPMDGATPTEPLVLANAAVATSGDLHQFVDIDGERYSHILEPRTGQALTRRSLVTVVAPRGIDADGWASALSVLGPEGLTQLESLPETEARVLTLPGERVVSAQTAGFADLLRTGRPGFLATP